MVKRAHDVSTADARTGHCANVRGQIEENAMREFCGLTVLHAHRRCFEVS
jgi:hypothetical protein